MHWLLSFRDWHGLAELVGIGGERVPHLQCGSDPTNKILTLWLKESKEDATVKKLLTYLEQLDRFDIVDDIKSSVGMLYKSFFHFTFTLILYKNFRRGCKNVRTK